MSNNGYNTKKPNKHIYIYNEMKFENRHFYKPNLFKMVKNYNKKIKKSEQQQQQQQQLPINFQSTSQPIHPKKHPKKESPLHGTSNIWARCASSKGVVKLAEGAVAGAKAASSFSTSTWRILEGSSQVVPSGKLTKQWETTIF